MRLHTLKAILKTAVIGAALLLMGVGLASAQAVNITALPTSVILPDGKSVPMWGYGCVNPSDTRCKPLNPNAGTGWSPILITVPYGTDLSISLLNKLVFNNNQIPTSLMIVGQLGGGLGDVNQRTKTASPIHDNQGTTWPIANTGATFTPPAQSDRVQSFGTEVPATTTGTLKWTGLRPGTYLLESGTHPSIQATMGLVGMLVVTSPPNGSTAGTAYPGVSYNAEIPLLFSEIDPVQNNAVATAVNTPGFSESATHGVSTSRSIVSFSLLNPGSGYTSAPTVTLSGGGATTQATAHAVISNGQVTAIRLDTPGSGYTGLPTVSLSAPTTGQAATAAPVLESNCNTSTGTTAACYPSVVNYSPRYYQINGVAFDVTHGTASLFRTTPASGIPANQPVLVRMVNAGSRMHVPAIVGSTTSGKSGFTLIAEDGNPVPGTARIQSEVFMAAGKTYDVMIDAPAGSTKTSALPIFDRQLSLSANAISRDAGMLGYISVNGNGLPAVPSLSVAPAAVADEYDAVIAGQTLTVSDPSKGVLANDINIFGVKVKTPPAGTVTLNSDGTFSYIPSRSWNGSDSFVYCGNGATSGPACATVKLTSSNVKQATGGIQLCPSTTNPCVYNATIATAFDRKAPGLLEGATDSTVDPKTSAVLGDLPLKAVPGTYQQNGITVVVNEDGSFSATGVAGQSIIFSFTAKNPLGETASHPATINFPMGSGLVVNVQDGTDKSPVNSYRWIIEEDRTFFVDPNCTGNPPPSGCPGYNVDPTKAVVPNFGTNFHTSFMPVIATGCTDGAACGNTQKVGDSAAPSFQKAISFPKDVALCSQVPAGTPCLDPNKRYFISVLPGDAAQPFINGYAGAPDCSPTGKAAGSCGHGMGGAPIPRQTTNSYSGATITVVTEPSPYPPATLSVFVFEDDFPLNGEHDAGGGVDIISPNEPGLGGFQITLQDDAGGTGDATGTPTYDMFNMPLSNSLAGTIDPVSGKDACPLTGNPRTGADGTASPDGITGMIITCPTYESDGITLSPLAGQAIVKNLYQGRYAVVANPGADRIARGEEWVQTNTLDGQKAHDAFMRIGEPAYFQEFGPAGYHVTIGFANPKIINDRYTGLCPKDGSNPDCKFKVTGHVTTARMSRTPDERLYGSGTHDSYSFTQCYISLGDPDAEELMFTKCAADGSFEFDNVPPGNWKITTFDQWNDQVVDGITTPVGLCATTTSITTAPPPASSCSDKDLGEVAVHQWQANIYTRTFIDTDYSGLSSDSKGNDKPGLALVDTNIRFRDGSFSNFNNTDLDGNAGFNEVFPLFNWYVIETDSTRYKSSGTHVVYDSGGPADGTLDSCPASGDGVPAGFQPQKANGAKPCGTSTIGQFMANTVEPNPLPTDLQIPGSVYCGKADCTGKSIANGSASSDAPASDGTSSTGRIDLPWFDAYGWQGYSGQNNFLEFGKRPFGDKETGSIHGHVVYASTRPFDDPTLLLQLSWEPLVPHVRVNLYKEDLSSDGVTKTLTLVDHTETSSFDDWAQGFRMDAAGMNPMQDANGGYIPNMNCPGQGTDTSTVMPDQYFWFGLKGQLQYLDQYGGGAHPLAHQSQFKCYDGMHNWNQLQPAPYDGMYSFPSVTARDINGKPTLTNCTGCIPNPESAKIGSLGASDPNYDPLRSGTPMLPAGKYVVEVVVPDGYELVKEEDKNILIGDNFIAPVTQQFGGLGSIFILPDQAAIGNAYNASNGQNSTNDLGRSSLPSHEADTGNVETFWPCVGRARVVPDYISLFPDSQEVAPFAGATRNLCDRKEVTLDYQTSALAKFYIFTETHKASHYTGVITDDFTAEFDPFSPQFGEKFGPAYLPVSFKDWAGNEIERVYSDAFGAYNGLSYSTWEVNPPNPTGYGPTMMVGCMNDAGPVPGPNGSMVNDPHFQKGYSQFCYELPFMPGQTGYFDTPVVPTAAFAGGYNNPDCAYPDASPAIGKVDGDTVGNGASSGTGPWIAAAGSAHPLVIHAQGSQNVDNYNYTGPAAGAPPYNQQTIPRTYSFGPPPTNFSSFGSAPIGQYFSCGATSGTGTPVCPYVTIDGKPMTVVSNGWTDSTITITVPTTTVNKVQVPVISACKLQQQAQYGGSTAYCGELQITRADNNNQSVDAVTVTIGGKVPTIVKPGAGLTPSGFGVLQTAIDKALPGDLLLVQPGTYSEMLLMWKPVRLQGVGAASVTIDANPHPAGKLDPWRQRVLCLFGLALDGRPVSASHPYNPADPNACQQGNPTDPANMFFSVDRLPLEATVGWDASLNGNLAEQLIEPTLMGAYEGAGITVLGKGVKFPNAGTDPTLLPFASDTFPTGTHLLDGQRIILTTTRTTAGDPYGCGREPGANTPGDTNPFPSNFYCNPSSIDGLTIQNSSQGGGAIWAHAWNHNLEIANNHIQNNQGTMSGGITIGQGEHPDVFQVGNIANTVPSSCISDTSGRANTALPYCNNVDVNVHHNLITHNASLGDELFSSTPAGAGGVTFCNGSDYYKFNYNFVCGNMSTGDGAGFAHVGFTYGGEIQHNAILFNQSTNPTIVTNGAGLLVMGAPDVDPACGLTTDQDCLNPPDQPPVPPSDGSGPGLVINANLIVGNSADSGSGGGLRLQNINGTEVINFPNANFNQLNNGTFSASNWPHIGNTGNGITHAAPDFQLRYRWNAISVTNNIIANNVAGIDGAGVSLLDALAVNFVNNTVINNVSTASSGVLLQTLFAPLASSDAGGFVNNCGDGQSCPQVAGLVSVQNSAVLTSNINPIKGSLSCPQQHGTKGSASDCTKYSVPALYNDVFWQNRSLIIGVGDPKAGFTIQQGTVTVKNPDFAGSSPTDSASQSATGGCNNPATNKPSYWDIGVRGDTAPGNHAGGTLAPLYSMFTNANGGNSLEAPDSTNQAADPQLLATYCNGSRVPPEASLSSSNPIFLGWQAPPGTNESNAMPAPKFTLAAGATTDEGNNWINLRWGPLSLNLPHPGSGGALMNPALATTSPAINKVPPPSNLNQFNPYTAAPSIDFFGTQRKTAGNPNVDVGAVEYPLTVLPPTLNKISPASGERGQSVTVTISGAHLNSVVALTVSGSGVTVFGVQPAPDGSSITATFTISATASALPPARSVTVTTNGGTASLPAAFTVIPPSLASITPSSGLRGTTVPLTLAGVDFTGATGLSGLGGNITVNNFAVVNDNKITANLVIASGAATGTRNVSVLSPNGNTNTVGFAVTAPVLPNLTSILPSSAVRGGGPVSVTLAGTGFTGATSVNIAGASITVGTFTVNSAGTQITTTINPAIGATLGTHNVTVTTPAGTSNSQSFRVVGSTLTFTSTGLTTPAADRSIKNGTITITNNTGANAAPLTLSADPTIARTSGAGTFVKMGGTCANGLTLAIGGSCTVNVKYTPPGSGSVISTVHVTVSGTGLNPNPYSSGDITAN